MTELILAGIIVVLLGGFGWFVREQNRERSKLINAILAKDSQEYVNRTLADSTQVLKPEVNPTDPDLLPMDQLSEEDFDKHIQATLGNSVEDEEQV